MMSQIVNKSQLFFLKKGLNAYGLIYTLLLNYDY